MTPMVAVIGTVSHDAWKAAYVASGVGSLLAMMLRYAMCFMVAGIGMTVMWMALDLPLGPGAMVHYVSPVEKLP